jgi:hypothetical protein
MLGPGGKPPSSEVAMALIDAKASEGGGGRWGRGREKAVKKEPVVKEKSTRAPSAFLLFTKDARPGLEAGLSFTEQQKALSAAWKALPEDAPERRKYVEMAEKLKEAAGMCVCVCVYFFL